MAVPKKKREDPAQLETLTLHEMREAWPRNEDGRMCARLLKRYGLTLLIESTAGAECTEHRAQAEAGASKAIARIVKDFGTLTVELSEAPVMTPLATLRKFQPKADQPKPTTL